MTQRIPLKERESGQEVVSDKVSDNFLKWSLTPSCSEAVTHST